MTPVPFSVRPSPRARGPLATATVLALCGLIAACSPDAADVASLSSPDADPAATSGDGSSTDPAGEFAACLRDNGVADVTLDDDGVKVGGPEASVTSSIDDSGNMTTMEVNGVDISAAWNTCTAQVPAYEELRTAEVEEMMPQFEEAAWNWVQCARDNGFTQFADPTDGVLVLPDGLTVEQATAVVAACPLDDVGAISSSGDLDAAVLDAFSTSSSAS